jgi:dihydroorotate dehydrogenase (NAD+) catalytic subunit
MVASGTFGYGDEANELMPVSELGALVTKTITSEPRAGNPPPRIVETPGGMLNSIGLQNIGAQAFLGEKLAWIRGAKGESKLIVNVGGKEAGEFELLCRMLSDAEGVDAVEINVSCPNVDAGGSAFFASPRELANVVRLSRRGTRLPLVVKLSPNVTDIVQLAKIAEEEGADALSLINTLNGMLVDVQRMKPVLGSVTGGLSGPAILPVGLYCVYKAKSAVSIPLIGIGGIGTADDALQYLMVGASLVQIGTANFLNPLAPREVIQGIGAYISQKGIREVSELVGIVH